MINMAQKTFVLDTNVLLFDPEALFKMEDNNIVILDIVLEEIDRFKSEQSERGQNSRKVSRYLDELKDKGSVINGVSLGEDKGKLFIHFSPTKETMKSFEFDLDKYDNRFLAYCAKNKDYILITKDVNLRVKASTLHLNAEDYQNDKIIRGDEMLMGRNLMKKFFAMNFLNFMQQTQIINLVSLGDLMERKL